jgi:excisionase family DNA binding protein
MRRQKRPGDLFMSIRTTEEALPKLKWLNIEQLVRILPLKKSRIYYLTHIGAIPHHKVGQTLLFREDEILEWMQANKVAS